MRNVTSIAVAVALLVAVGLMLMPPSAGVAAEPAGPATQGAAAGEGAFPFMTIDGKSKQIRVECEALRVATPLEFFLCLTGSTEHESVLRSKVRPSHLHAALLMLGLKPGEPVRLSNAQNKWLPPHGPPLQLTAEFQKDGRTITIPAYRLMRDVRTKKEMPPMTWIFAGSKIINDTYAADRTGYLVSVVNFELSVIDIPKLASNANETLEWETHLELMPADVGTPVTLIIEPAGKVEAPADVGNGTGTTVAPAAAPAGAPGVDQTLVSIDAKGQIAVDGVEVKSAEAVVALLKQLSAPRKPVRVAVANAIEENPTAREVMNALAAADVRFAAVPQAAALGTTTGRAGIPGEIRADEALVRTLRGQWDRAVAPHAAGLRDAARTHYDVIAQLRREQQRLVDEADKIQRLIDELEKQYQDMTTPGPQ